MNRKLVPYRLCLQLFHHELRLGGVPFVFLHRLEFVCFAKAVYVTRNDLQFQSKSSDSTSNELSFYITLLS